MPNTSRPKTIYSISKEKNRRIPESCCTRQKTGDIDNVTTSSNGDNKIIQPIRIRSRTSTRRRNRSQFQIILSQRTNYNKELGWVHFDNKPKVQDKL